MTTSVFKTETSTSFGVFAGSSAKLDKIDLTFLNLRFANINSKKFNDFIKTYSRTTDKNHNKSAYKYLQKQRPYDWLFVLFPIDISKPVDEEILLEVQNLVLLAFPSDFKLYAIVNYQLFDYKYLYENSTSTYHFFSTGDSVGDNYLYVTNGDIKQLNLFSKLFFQSKTNLKYLETTIASYISSFTQIDYRMEYLNLVISLESIISGVSELNYRIKRACAVINGRDEATSWIIYENVNKLYDLRSKIVHGEKVSTNMIVKYLPILRAMVSRTIIELITFNISDKTELNNKLTETGFGEKKKLCKNYKEFELNRFSSLKIRVPISKQ